MRQAEDFRVGSRLRLNVLGGFSLLVDDVPIELPGQAQRVLGSLAVSDRVQRRDGLIARLWPDAPHARGQACLRTAIWRVRQVDPRVLCVSQSAIRVADDVTIDLEDAIALARQLLQGEHILPAGAGVAIWQKDLLPDWDHEWLIFDRERIRQMRIHALESLSHSLSAAGRHAEAIEAACAAISSEPLRDSAHAALISAHIREKNRSDAVRAFNRYAAISQAEMGLPPSRSIAALLREVLED